jgi:hypothetical protein
MKNEGRSEALPTGGLFLIFSAVVAAVMSVSNWGAGEVAMSVAAGVVAVVSFVSSVACFLAQAEETAPEGVAHGL